MSLFLGILWSVVLWLLAIVAGLLLVLLVVPFAVGGRGWVSGLSAGGEGWFRWGFGMVSCRVLPAGHVEVRLLGVRVYRTTVARLAAGAGKKKGTEGPEEKGRGGFRLAYVRPLVAMVVRVLRTVRLQGWVAGVVGVGDPAETAAVAALLDPLNGRRSRFTIAVTPDWIDERVDLQGEVRLGFWLPRTVLICILIVVDRENRQVLRAIARKRR